MPSSTPYWALVQDGGSHPPRGTQAEEHVAGSQVIVTHGQASLKQFWVGERIWNAVSGRNGRVQTPRASSSSWTPDWTAPPRSRPWNPPLLLEPSSDWIAPESHLNSSHPARLEELLHYCNFIPLINQSLTNTDCWIQQLSPSLRCKTNQIRSFDCSV